MALALSFATFRFSLPCLATARVGLQTGGRTCNAQLPLRSPSSRALCSQVLALPSIA